MRLSTSEPSVKLPHHQNVDMVSRTHFPILDYSQARVDYDAFSKKLFAVCSEWGFFILTGTDIKPRRMFELSQEFFNLPLELKATKIMNEKALGYDGKAKTTFAASEGMSFGTTPGGVLETDDLPEWWDHDKRNEVEAFKADCYDLSSMLLSCFADQLGFSRDFFRQSHLHKDPGNTLKLIRYPPMAVHPGQEIPRLSEHTDWGSITFVFTNQAGLEIRDPQNHWRQIPVVEDGIVINIGDALSLWTGKALKSTMHRITWENLPLDKDRYSIAYFTNPNYDAIMRPEKANPDPSHPVITYRDYYKIRLRLTYGHLKGETGQNQFEDVDAQILNTIRKLEVANAGILESHAIVA
ncbi:hypothetical protein RBB50_012875 [Rhinocladiella similis]